MVASAGMSEVVPVRVASTMNWARTNLRQREATSRVRVLRWRGDDLFFVYLVNQDGSLIGPIWIHHQKDGLDTPDIPLFKQFKESIEAATKVPTSKAPTP
jgi:hypothetical protein